MLRYKILQIKYPHSSTLLTLKIILFVSKAFSLTKSFVKRNQLAETHNCYHNPLFFSRSSSLKSLNNPTTVTKSNYA